MNKFDEPRDVYVYCIECETPLHFYVGVSGRLSERIRHHRQGKQRFTRVHGVKSVFKVIKAPTRNIALHVENLLYKTLTKQGVAVGYYDKRA